MITLFWILAIISFLVAIAMIVDVQRTPWLTWEVIPVSCVAVSLGLGVITMIKAISLS